jgi:glycosyltransferase involved in cell wall biosynthesis
METLRISIAMCTYNGARFLPEQLESLAGQTRTPDELVICDDGSTDDTADVVQTFAARAGFPVYFKVNETRLGTARNFAKAISCCQFEIIALCDQDDVWHPEKLRRIGEVLAANKNAGAVFSDAELIDEDSKPLGETLWTTYRVTPRDQGRFEGGQGLKVLLKHDSVTGATLAFRSIFRDLILPVPPEQHHDLWIAMLIASVSHLVALGCPLVSYRKHGAQQIGPGIKFSFWQKLPRQIGPDYYLHEVQRLREICDRLEQGHVAFVPHPNAIGLIRQKINHRKARAEFPNSRILRLPAVMHEAVTLGYWRYSSGLGSLAKDLLV